MSTDSIPKYQTASAIVGQVLKHVLSVVSPGMSVSALCTYSNSLVEAYSGSVYRKEKDIERGVSFPTTISVNNVIQNFAPSPDNDYVLREGDVVKVEVSAHIDGYISSAAHTTVATNSPSIAIEDRRADAISAAYYASEVAVRMIRPGQTARNLVKAIGLVASGFNCNVAEETFTCQIDRFVMSGKNTFANRFDPDYLVPELTFETGEIYTIDCTLSSGDGKARASESDPAIYQRDVNQLYSLKLRTSRALFSEVCRRYSVFPFLMREVTDANPSLKAGINECTRSQLLVPFAVTVDKKHGGSIVAQFKLTVMCNYTGPIRLTQPLPMPNVQSATAIPQGSEIGQILSLEYEQSKLPELPRLKTQIQAPIPIHTGSNEHSSMDMS
ncbi:Creatinase/aminopeptidase [Martensiomyces pterosporus]|nr:Creatinase/aminopeptidase [Martensiomyces pterosporus]